MILIDTNVLVYATLPGFPEHASARRIVEDLASRPEPLCLTWVNVFEYLRVVTHRRLVRPAPLPLERALANVDALLGQPDVVRIDPGPRHWEMFALVCREAAPVEGNFVHDCRIAAIMRENGVRRILTRDTSFRRIPGLEVVDLVSPGRT